MNHGSEDQLDAVQHLIGIGRGLKEVPDILESVAVWTQSDGTELVDERFVEEVLDFVGLGEGTIHIPRLSLAPAANRRSEQIENLSP